MRVNSIEIVRAGLARKEILKRGGKTENDQYYTYIHVNCSWTKEIMPDHHSRHLRTVFSQGCGEVYKASPRTKQLLRPQYALKTTLGAFGPGAFFSKTYVGIIVYISQTNKRRYRKSVSSNNGLCFRPDCPRSCFTISTLYRRPRAPKTPRSPRRPQGHRRVSYRYCGPERQTPCRISHCPWPRR